jgi:predicted transcriptional regulator
MTLSVVRDVLRCDIFTGAEQSGLDVNYGCASDLMSDVLAFSRAGSLLLTGLVTVQTIQTAFIAEIAAVIFVRGKRPGNEVIALAKEKEIPVLGTPYSMYEACGILYRRGLNSTMELLEHHAHK